jgi:hypothetical protein
MENLFAVLLLTSFILLIIGLFSPKTSLFWYKKERTIKLSLLIYGICTILFFALFGVTAPDINTAKEQLRSVEEQGLSQKQKDSANNEALQERINNTFNASDIVAAYSKNEVKADDIFKDKTFYVTGYVDKVGKDITNNTYVTLKSGDLLREVQCFVEDQNTLANLSPGQLITIHGTGGGLMFNVLVQDGTIVDNLTK